MPNNYLSNPLAFLVGTLFSLYILAVMLRFLLQMVRADFYNPVSQFLVKITHPILRPMRRFIPSFRKFDTASVVLMIVLQTVSVLLVQWIRGYHPGVAAVVILSVAQLVSLLLNVFLVAILIEVVVSWINPGGYNPALALVYSLTEPVLRPARNVIPPIAGLDLSPLVVLIAIQVIKMLVLPPLHQVAYMLG